MFVSMVEKRPHNRDGIYSEKRTSVGMNIGLFVDKAMSKYYRAKLENVWSYFSILYSRRKYVYVRER